MKKHLHIILFVTLALEVAVKVRASMAQLEARGGGRSMRECGVRGRDDLLLQRTLSEFQETFKSQYETELFIKHLLGVRKILKSYFFKNN